MMNTAKWSTRHLNIMIRIAAVIMLVIAAIPATIFYNKFASEVNKHAQRLEGFADEFAAILSRQIDERT